MRLQMVLEAEYFNEEGSLNSNPRNDFSPAGMLFQSLSWLPPAHSLPHTCFGSCGASSFPLRSAA